jgi:hypothetical protein
MGRSSKESWLSGPGDLKEADVEDVPVEGESVRVRGLPAAYSRDVISDCIEQRQIGETTINQVNARKLAVRQFAHGCVEPQFTVEEADAVAQKYGPAFEKVVSKVDELSGVDKEGIEEAQARFQSSGNGATDEGEAGDIAAPVGGSGPDLHS